MTHPKRPRRDLLLWALSHPRRALLGALSGIAEEYDFAHFEKDMRAAIDAAEREGRDMMRDEVGVMRVKSWRPGSNGWN